MGGGGDDLVPTMSGCVCPKVKDMGPFSACDMSEMSENVLLKMGVKFAVSFNMHG